MLTVFKEAASYIKYILLCVSYNVKSSISNRKSFIIQAIAMFVSNFVFILFWFIIFENKGGSIGDTTMKDIIYLWAVPVMAFGICYFCFGGVHTLCTDIANGDLDIYLTKPKHSLISQLTSRSELSAMGDFLSGVVCGLIAVSFNPLKFLWLLVLSIIAAVAFLAIVTCTCLLAFWIGDITSSSRRYVNTIFLTLTIYPEQMFPKIIKIAMYTVIPAAYVSHVPIRIVKEQSFVDLLLLLAAVIFFGSLMFFMYKKGLKRYESGNGGGRR